MCNRERLRAGMCQLCKVQVGPGFRPGIRIRKQRRARAGQSILIADAIQAGICAYARDPICIACVRRVCLSKIYFAILSCANSGSWNDFSTMVAIARVGASSRGKGHAHSWAKYVKVAWPGGKACL